PPWPMRDPVWFCGALTEYPEPYLTVLGSRQVGFALRDGLPVSTYVPYQRPKSSTRIASFIEAAAEDEMSDDAYLRLLLSVGEHAELVKEERASELPEGEETNRDAWGEYLELLHEVSGEDEDGATDHLARDLSTRYQWRVPKDLPYRRISDKTREKLWREVAAVAFAGPRQTFKRGRPGAGEDRNGLLVDWEDRFNLWLTERRLRQAGYPRALPPPHLPPP